MEVGRRVTKILSVVMIVMVVKNSQHSGLPAPGLNKTGHNKIQL